MHSPARFVCRLMSQTQPAKRMLSRPPLDAELWAKILGIIKADNFERKFKPLAVRSLAALMDNTLHRRMYYIVEPRAPNGCVAQDIGCNPGCEWMNQTIPYPNWIVSSCRCWVMAIECVTELLRGHQPGWCWKCYERHCAPLFDLVDSRAYAEQGAEPLVVLMMATQGVLHPSASAASCTCSLLLP